MSKELRKMSEVDYSEINQAFEENTESFFMDAYRDGELRVKAIENTSVIAFNIWSFLTRAEPKFDELRIRLATAEEVEAWEKGEAINE